MKFFTLREATFSPQKIASFEEQRQKFIVAIAPPHLTEIYEVNRLADLIGLRAESRDSPEFEYLIKQGHQIPANQQNPNFDHMVKLLSQIRQEKKLILLKRLVVFLESLALPRLNNINLKQLDLWSAEVTANIDIRFCDSVPMYLSYLYNKYQLV